uniref:MADF domain-containing protein n=1 Tax=Bactrocera dorsalis TaxID=27457 RepID=A0A034WA46_BACDO
MSLENNPQILSLIQAVRKNKVLYDTRHVNYLDADERTNRIWEDVALECGYDNGADAEKAWKDLKTNFMTNYHSKFIPNGVEKSNESGSDDPNCWDYYSEMRFILQFTAVNTDPGELFEYKQKQKIRR